MKRTQLPADTISERDAAWFEEVTGTAARGRAGLLALQNPAGDWAGEPCDTALSLVALADSAARPCEAAVAWLLKRDFADTGTAATVLTALARGGYSLRAACGATIHRAIDRLLNSQNRDGGWPALDGEPSCPAATAGALEALGHFGFRTGQPPVNAAIKFLLARQEEGGEWLTYRGAGGVATTGRVIAGLRACGSDVYALPVRRAVRWLKESQDGDGGWGESTAAAVLALLAAGEGEGAEMRAGVEFLVGTQRANGTWDGATPLSLLALGGYLSDRDKPAEVRKVHVRIDAGHRATGPKAAPRHTLAEW